MTFNIKAAEQILDEVIGEYITEYEEKAMLNYTMHHLAQKQVAQDTLAAHSLLKDVVYS